MKKFYLVRLFSEKYYSKWREVRVEATSFRQAEELALKSEALAKPEVASIMVDPNPADCKSRDQLVDIRLSDDDWNRLTTYLWLSKSHREGERDAWRRLSEKRNEDGSPAFPNASGNADFWDDEIAFVDRIDEAIKKRHVGRYCILDEEAMA